MRSSCHDKVIFGYMTFLQHSAFAPLQTSFLDIVCWLFVLVLWQQLLLVRGICLRRTALVTIGFTGDKIDGL